MIASSTAYVKDRLEHIVAKTKTCHLRDELVKVFEDELMVNQDYIRARPAQTNQLQAEWGLRGITDAFGASYSGTDLLVGCVKLEIAPRDSAKLPIDALCILAMNGYRRVDQTPYGMKGLMVAALGVSFLTQSGTVCEGYQMAGTPMVTYSWNPGQYPSRPDEIKEEISNRCTSLGIELGDETLLSLPAIVMLLVQAAQLRNL